MEKMVEIVNLNYGKLFKNLYLDVFKGELLMVIGKNGCGKTTLSNIIFGNIETLDNVLIDSELINYYDKKNIVLLNGFEHIDNHILVSNLFKNYDKNIVLKIFKQYKKQNIMDRYCDELSSGDLQLVNILLVILDEPRVIIIDDSISLVDKKNKIKLLKYLKTFCFNKSITIIYFTSDVEDLVHANNIAIINDKKIDIMDDRYNILINEKIFNQIDYKLPFIADLCLKLKYYDLIDKLLLDEVKLVNKLWK